MCGTCVHAYQRMLVAYSCHMCAHVCVVLYGEGKGARRHTGRASCSRVATGSSPTYHSKHSPRHARVRTHAYARAHARTHAHECAGPRTQMYTCTHRCMHLHGGTPGMQARHNIHTHTRQLPTDCTHATCTRIHVHTRHMLHV